MLDDSYMRPHCHPSREKIEKMYLIQGGMDILMFNEKGSVDSVIRLEEGKLECCEIPAFAYHTYVMKTEKVICYETMLGVYDPNSWKRFPDWAPEESDDSAKSYLKKLKTLANKWF